MRAGHYALNMPNPPGLTELCQIAPILKFEKYKDKLLLFEGRLGEPSNRIFGKIWEFGPTEGGGGLRIPNFYPIFPEQTLLW